MKRIKDAYERLREEYSKLTVFAIVLLVVSCVPDWHARAVWWYGVSRWFIKALGTPYGRVVLIIFGILIIWLDHRAMLKRGKGEHIDEKTLRGRVLKLIADIQQFMKEMGIPPEWNNQVDKSTEICLWVVKIQSGFALKFSERLQTLYWELGFEGLMPVISSPRTDVVNEDQCQEIIDFLKKRVAQMESRQP